MRLEKNLSQEALAKKIGRSRNYITKLESHDTFVSLESIINLSNILGVSIDYLLHESLTLDKTNDDLIIEDFLRTMGANKKQIVIGILSAIKDLDIPD